MEDEIIQRFTTQQLTVETAQQVEAWKTNFRSCAVAIAKKVPNCRERSLALTALEEASMWVTAALARNQQE